MSDYEKSAKQFEAEVAKALEHSAPLPPDLLKFFCDNWEMIKKVLQAIGDAIGGIVKIIIGLVISALQAAHDRYCKPKA